MEQPQRLSDYVAGIFKTVPTRKGMKKAIKKGLVHINGTQGYTGDYLRGGERIDLFREVDDTPQLDLKMPIKILFEDDYLAVVHKPAGIVVSGNRKWTLENALIGQLKQSTRADFLAKAQAIHRLDYPTTGVLLIGKTLEATTKLNQIFEKRKVEKIYYAVTVRNMRNTGVIDFDVDEKSAHSTFTVLKTVKSEKYEALNLVEIHPATGRKHQIRKHLAYIGNPIFGDKQYGLEGFIHKGKGLYLHAGSLAFFHPYTQEMLKIESPLPEKFQSIFND